MTATLTDHLTLTPIDGGFRVKETATHYLDVMQMLFSWRVVETPKSCPLVYDRYWCYQDTSYVSLLRVVAAVIEWDGSAGTEPVGWNKNGQTGEWVP